VITDAVSKSTVARLTEALAIMISKNNKFKGMGWLEIATREIAIVLNRNKLRTMHRSNSARVILNIPD
jgi:hypothetical protein